MLQYNLTPSSKSQYNIVLQYKLSPQAFFSAIQYSVLQYNFPLFSSLLLCNTMTILQYNFLYFKPSLQYNPAIQCLAYLLSHNTLSVLQYNFYPFNPFKLQYNWNLAIQKKKKFTQYCLGNSPKTVPASIFFFFFIFHFHSFQLLENSEKNIYTLFFSPFPTLK